MCLLTSCDGKGEKGTAREYYFCSQGITFTVGDDADKIVCALGEPNYKTVAPSCADTGDDELYVYSGFRIYAHRDANGCCIKAIELTNDAVSTSEGVKIGDFSARIYEIYGEGMKKNGAVEYSAEKLKLRFFVRDGRVIGIKYLENDG